MALDCTSRTTLETVMPHFKAEANAGVHRSGGASGTAVAAVPPGLLGALKLLHASIENAALSAEQLRQLGMTEDLCTALKWISAATERQSSASSGIVTGQQLLHGDVRDWAMRVVAVVDRLKRSLSDQAHHAVVRLQVGHHGRWGLILSNTGADETNRSFDAVKLHM